VRHCHRVYSSRRNVTFVPFVTLLSPLNVTPTGTECGFAVTP
jgi:hypothetical protein